MKEITDPKELERLMGKSPKGKPAEPIQPIPSPEPQSVGPIMEAAMRPPVIGRAPEIGDSAPALTGQWQVVKTEKLHPREDNPRHINVKSKPFRELVESIRAAGIVTPLLGRPHPQRPGCVELLAGHRRRLAGEAAGLDEYPVVVREMDDRTALEVLVFENLDRENLTPLEEARGVDLLLRSNHEAGEIAARMGKTVQWVARRAQLLQLTSQWKKWAEEREVSAAHLELVARLPKAAQDDLFETLTQDGDGETDTLWMGAGTLATLRERIAEHLMELKGAPWDIENAVLLPKAGACSACPKRSGCQPTLFGDPEDGGDRCLDKSCWKEKRKAHIERRKAELQKEHRGLVLIRGKGADWDEGKGALSDWQFSECKATAAGAKPALIVCGKGEGSLTWVTTERSGGTRESGSEKKKDSAATKQAAASLDPKASAKLLAEKQEAHELRRWAWVCRRLQEMIDEAELPLEPSMQTAAGLCEMVALFGTDNTSYLTARAKPWEALQRVETAGGMETRQEVWRGVRPKLKQTLEVFTVSSISKEHHAAIKGAAWLMGTTVEALKADADAEIPEPKSWEQLRKLSEAPAPAKKTAKGAKAGDKKPSVKKKGKAA
jgi:ParB/RepB/Spo0J family partition protein